MSHLAAEDVSDCGEGGGAAVPHLAQSGKRIVTRVAVRQRWRGRTGRSGSCCKNREAAEQDNGCCQESRATRSLRETSAQLRSGKWSCMESLHGWPPRLDCDGLRE